MSAVFWFLLGNVTSISVLLARQWYVGLPARWKDAVYDFLDSPAGASWPGGDENRERIGKIIESRWRLKYFPSVQTIEKAWKIMKTQNVVTAVNAVVTSSRF